VRHDSDDRQLVDKRNKLFSNFINAGFTDTKKIGIAKLLFRLKRHYAEN